MTQTKYPISKIRSGEVAVLLTDIEQFKKITPEQKQIKKHFKLGSYHLFSKFHKAFTFVTNDYIESFNEKTCQFHQIDWEEGKEEGLPLERRIEIHIETTEECIENSNIASFLAEMLREDNSLLLEAKNQLSTLKAENERLKRENERLVKCNDELSNIMQKKIIDDIKLNYSQNQELSLRQRMAWEIVNTSDLTDEKLRQAYAYVDNFLNYKEGENEQ